eukprot:CAMPEP_0172474300 /NCGR_PEP_ID=MMETSP1065-20121228/69289_1 /TAXON_ID=265537 /ORGANISM="Amphiprora paludosa, Strain CCMP125" /LENGTH=198 /DNA_ID=CAMNT_0013232479 /DNA_START=1720 /DNA_END=2316 /DNA_ORIENTATION=-
MKIVQAIITIFALAPGIIAEPVVASSSNVESTSNLRKKKKPSPGYTHLIVSVENVMHEAGEELHDEPAIGKAILRALNKVNPNRQNGKASFDEITVDAVFEKPHHDAGNLLKGRSWDQLHNVHINVACRFCIPDDDYFMSAEEILMDIHKRGPKYHKKLEEEVCAQYRASGSPSLAHSDHCKVDIMFGMGDEDMEEVS